MAQGIISNPVAVRLKDGELCILKRMRSELSRPGIPVSTSDTVKVALHEWALAHPSKEKAGL
jgi:hypothetical protein